jgi:hypothetical protein
METYKIGDKITYSDDAEMSQLFGLTPSTYTGTITAIYDNGLPAAETSNPYATLTTDCEASVIAIHAKRA